MAGQIHVVRHAESVHNVTKDFSELDPPLTVLGLRQASSLAQTLNAGPRIAVVYTSPLRRAIQTTLAGFHNVLDKRDYPASVSGEGVENGAELVVDPHLQERSALNCDTGSDRETLKKQFPTLDFRCLGDVWPSKDGIFTADDKAVNRRARHFRATLVDKNDELQGQERGDVAVVTHGAFMKALTGDLSIDLPKAGWQSFVIERKNVEDSVLVPVAAET